MARKTVRINVPLGNPDELVALAGAIHKKSTELGANSPLKGLTDLDLEDFGDKVTEADTQRKAAKDFERKTQEANGRATNLLGVAPSQTQSTTGTLRFAVTQISDLLAAVNKANEEALTGWGLRRRG